MGVVWRDGSRYDGFYGAVWWVRLAYRSANNFAVLLLAARLRDLPNAVLAGDNPYTPPAPDPSWAEYGNLRVVAWNGSASDIP